MSLRALQLLVSFVLLSLTVQSASAERSAVRNFGVMYDELHGFVIEGPEGWGGLPKKNAIEWEPLAPLAGIERVSLELAYDYLPAKRMSFDAYVDADVRKIDVLGNAMSRASLPVSDGRMARSWSVMIPSERQYYLLAYFLEEGVYIIRFQLLVESPDSLERLTPVFKEFVAHYRRR